MIFKDKTMIKQNKVVSNPVNFCGGNFKEWLEVMLTPSCNGRCEWCIDKEAFHPKKHASVETIIEKINNSKYTKIILLGGEPTLYKNLDKLCDGIKKEIYVTTNGSNIEKLYQLLLLK